MFFLFRDGRPNGFIAKIAITILTHGLLIAGHLHYVSEIWFLSYFFRQMSDDSAILDECGAVLAEVGENTLASEALRRSVTLNPEQGFETRFHKKNIFKDELFCYHMICLKLICWYSHVYNILKVKPDFRKYLTLGQLSQNEESLKFLQCGIELLEKEAPQDKRKLSKAFCNVADLYMTDLCMLPNAQIACKEAVDRALKTDRQWFRNFKIE